MKEIDGRLVDDASSASEQMRTDLARAAETPARKYDQKAGLARLTAAIGGGGLVAASAGAKAAGTAAGKSVLGSAVVLWSLAGLGGVAVVGGVAYTALDEERPAATDTTAPAEPRPSEIQPATPPAAEPEAVPDEEPAVPAPAAPGPRAPAAGPEPPDGDQILREETAHLAALRAIEGDPARALEMADDGQRRFRRGMFAEEREAMAIFALDRLGRDAEARTRGRRFLSRHPTSTFGDRVRAVIDGR